jgi:hypothetical protein
MTNRIEVRIIAIPASVEDAVAALGGIESLLTAKDWERAAIVAAFVQPGAGQGTSFRSERSLESAGEFARRGIAGLTSAATVLRYVSAWMDANEGERPEPGTEVELPLTPFPATERRFVEKTPEALVTAITKAAPAERKAIFQAITQERALNQEMEAVQSRHWKEALESGRKLHRDADPDTADFGRSAYVHVQFQHARDRLTKALEAVREVNLDDTMRDDLTRISGQTRMLLDWIDSYIASGDRSFDAELDALLAEGGE